MFALQAEFESIESQKREIVAKIDALSDEQRGWKAKSGDWSALQIAEHLILGDETVGSTLWAKRQIESGKTARVHPIRFNLICLAMRRDVRLPLPSPEFEPRGVASWAELLARWEKARLELQNHLQSPDFEPQARPFLHTVAGALSAGDLLKMSFDHNGYHMRQLDRLVASQPPRDGSR